MKFHNAINNNGSSLALEKLVSKSGAVNCELMSSCDSRYSRRILRRAGFMILPEEHVEQKQNIFKYLLHLKSIMKFNNDRVDLPCHFGNIVYEFYFLYTR